MLAKPAADLVSLNDVVESVCARHIAKGGTASASACNEGFLGRMSRSSSEEHSDVLQESSLPSTSMASLLETTGGTPSAWEQTLRG